MLERRGRQKPVGIPVPKVRQPKTVLKNVNGFYYHDNRLISREDVFKLCGTDREMVIKPTLDTGGGKNVVMFTCTEGSTNYKIIRWVNYLGAIKWIL